MTSPSFPPLYTPLSRAATIYPHPHLCTSLCSHSATGLRRVSVHTLHDPDQHYR